MKNSISSSRSLAAINRSLAAVGESVDRCSFARPAAPSVECDEVAAINRSLEWLGDVSIAAEDLEPVVECDEVAAANRSLEWLGESVDEAFLDSNADNAYFEPDSHQIEIGLGNVGELRFDGYDVYAHLAGHDRFADVRGLGEGCADLVREAIFANRDSLRFSNDDSDAINRSLSAVGEEI